jgi:hypothetical protein
MTLLLGRFLTKDTFTGFEDDPQSLNLYAYTENNPITYIDPDGYSRITITPYGGGGGLARSGGTNSTGGVPPQFIRGQNFETQY